MSNSLGPKVLRDFLHQDGSQPDCVHALGTYGDQVQSAPVRTAQDSNNAQHAGTVQGQWHNHPGAHAGSQVIRSSWLPITSAAGPEHKVQHSYPLSAEVVGGSSQRW